MYRCFWLNVECPCCEEDCWIDYGDISDASGYDPDSFTCWNCEKSFDMEGEEVEEGGCDALESPF